MYIDAASPELVTLDPALDVLFEGLRPHFSCAASPTALERKAVRLIPHGEAGVGWRECFNVREGFSVLSSDLTPKLGHLESFRGGGHLKIHFRLDGDSTISPDGQSETPLGPGTMAFLVQPNGSLKTERVLSIAQEKSVTLLCGRDFLDQAMVGSQAILPEPINAFLQGRDPGFWFVCLPIGAGVRGLVEDLIGPPTAGLLDGLRREARALDLLCSALKSLIDAPLSGALRQKDIRKVEEICQLLQSRYAEPPTIVELCRIFAWNETQLMSSFKTVTGMTVFSYRQRIRMDYALRRLKTSDTSVAEVAYEAGYEHAANFATAFRREFGISPKMARVSAHQIKATLPYMAGAEGYFGQ